MFDTRKCSSFLEMLYSDRMDITSVVEDTDEDGAAVTTYPTVPQQTDVPCRISFSQKDGVEKANDTNEVVSLKATLHCGVDVNIRAGDKIVVRRYHADGTSFDTFEGLIPLAGRPNKWRSHQEVELTLEGDA